MDGDGVVIGIEHDDFEQAPGGISADHQDPVATRSPPCRTTRRGTETAARMSWSATPCRRALCAISTTTGYLVKRSLRGPVAPVADPLPATTVGWSAELLSGNSREDCCPDGGAVGETQALSWVTDDGPGSRILDRRQFVPADFVRGVVRR